MLSPTHSQTLPGEPAPADPTGQPEVVSQGADATMREMMVDELAFDTDMVIDDDQIGVPPSQAGSLAAHPPEINAADLADARRARDREHQRLARARE